MWKCAKGDEAEGATEPGSAGGFFLFGGSFFLVFYRCQNVAQSVILLHSTSH